MTANTILDRAFPIEPHIDQAIHDAALGLHEQDAMCRAAGITVVEVSNAFVSLTLFAVRQDCITFGMYLTEAQARARAYEIAQEQVEAGMVGDLD